MNTIIEEFRSVAEYIGTINKRKVNKVFKNSECSSQDDGRYDFFMTNTYKEANCLAATGYKEGLDQMKSVFQRVTHRENIEMALPTVNVVGYAPHVANAIAGVPKSMIDKVKVPQKAKVVTILYDLADSARVDIRKFVESGKNLLDVIITLETLGYRVGLYIMNTSCREEERAISITMAKHWQQPSNPLKLSYPLIHPSFFRRHHFRWLETQPDLTESGFSGTYGHPLYKDMNSNDDMVTFLKEKKILKQNWFYVGRRYAAGNNASDLIKLMGI